MRLRMMSQLFLLVLACALPVSGQDPTIEYGQPDELRGVTKIFVDTRTNVRRWEKIVKTITRRLPNIQVVSRPEESDIHLRYSLRDSRNGQREGLGTVVKLIGGNRERVLLSVEDEFPPIFDGGGIVSYGMEQARPLMFAIEFVKAYRRANG
jgi:hypothetical protein